MMIAEEWEVCKQLWRWNGWNSFSSFWHRSNTHLSENERKKGCNRFCALSSFSYHITFLAILIQQHLRCGAEQKKMKDFPFLLLLSRVEFVLRMSYRSLSGKMWRRKVRKNGYFLIYCERLKHMSAMSKCAQIVFNMRFIFRLKKATIDMCVCTERNHSKKHTQSQELIKQHLIRQTTTATRNSISIVNIYLELIILSSISRSLQSTIFHPR